MIRRMVQADSLALAAPVQSGFTMRPRSMIDRRARPDQRYPATKALAMILLIDNYDSFTFNLYHFLGDVGAQCEVWRNDKLSVADALAMQPEAIVLSPGPCTPTEAGICLDLIAAAAGNVPLLGVCLGHQAIGQAFGGKVIRAPEPMHGKVCRHHPCGDGHPGRPALAVPRDPLPQPDRRAGVAARYAGADRLDRRTAWSWRCTTARCRSTACSSIPRASPASTATPSWPTSWRWRAARNAPARAA